MRRVLAAALAALLLFGLAACAPVPVSEAHLITPRPTAAATLIPTAAPTSTPTPTPVPSPTETPDPAACDAYFSDVVFVGDSLTVGLCQYVRRLRKKEGACLGDAAFVAGEGVSIRVLKNDRIPVGTTALKYGGEPVSITRGVNDSGKTHAIILLGTNDLGGVHLEQTMKNYRTLLDRIAARCPDVTTVTLMAVPPVSQRFCENENFSIAEWNAVNPAIEQLCAERGLFYLSFAEAVSDENGYLDPMYSSDNLVHLSAEGFQRWLEALRLFAAERLTES